MTRQGIHAMFLFHHFLQAPTAVSWPNMLILLGHSSPLHFCLTSVWLPGSSPKSKHLHTWWEYNTSAGWTTTSRVPSSNQSAPDKRVLSCKTGTMLSDVWSDWIFNKLMMSELEFLLLCNFHLTDEVSEVCCQVWRLVNVICNFLTRIFSHRSLHLSALLSFW